MLRRLPASPSRLQALIEFEPLLLSRFERLASRFEPTLRDSMHYALFSQADRFCVSAAWLVAERIGVPAPKLADVACSLEMLRCSLASKLRPVSSSAGERFVEPAVAEAASYGLVPLAYEALLDSENALTPAERSELALVAARFASPVNTLAAAHRETQALRGRGRLSELSREALQQLQQERVSPVFEAMGQALAVLSPQPSARSLGRWFARLGLFALWLEEFSSGSQSPLALTQLMSLPEAMDQIKSLEAELLETSRELGARDAAHELIEPLADVLKTRLQ